MNQNNNTKDLYKIYQLMEFFTNKFSFNNFMVKNFVTKNEFWLTNPNNDTVNLIRLSVSSLDETYQDKKRIEDYINAVKFVLKKEIKFIDIHISSETVLENEAFKSICINTNYYSGEEIEFAFPGIKNVIHEVDNPEGEIALCIQAINENIKVKQKQSKELFKLKYKINATLIIQILCIINFIGYILLAKEYDSATAEIILGADFKFFTLNLKEYWRLFTYAFVHGGILHLLVNMYTLYYLGNHYEMKLGTVKYLIVLFTSIVIAGLTNDVFTGINNSLTIGMSGGIYALFAMYIIEAIEKGAYQIPSFMMMVFVNILLNFMSNVAWKAHLGGALAGLIFYYAFKDNKVDYKVCILFVIIVIGLIYKLNTFSGLDEYYLGTVNSVINAFNDLGLKNIANNLTNNVYNYFIK